MSKIPLLTDVQIDFKTYSVWVWTFSALNIGIVTFLAFCIIVGLIGNISIIGAICTHKGLWRPLNLFIINLSIADLVLVTFISSTSITGLTKGYYVFLQNHRLCNIVANVCLTVCVVSLLTHMVIAVTRYCSMRYGSAYERLFTSTNSVLACFTIWIVAFFLQFPPNVGWGRNVYDRKAMICIWDRTYSIGYTLYFGLVYVFTPISIIFFCYFQLFFYIRRIGRNVGGHGQKIKSDTGHSTSGPSANNARVTDIQPNVWTTQPPCHDAILTRGPKSFSESRNWKREVKLARTMFSHFALVFFLWGQYAVIVVSDFRDNFPVVVHAISIQIAHSIAVFNVFVYLANKNFRDGMINFIIKRPLRIFWPHNEYLRSIGHTDTTRVSPSTHQRDIKVEIRNVQSH